MFTILFNIQNYNTITLVLLIKQFFLKRNLLEDSSLRIFSFRGFQFSCTTSTCAKLSVRLYWFETSGASSNYIIFYLLLYYFVSLYIFCQLLFCCDCCSCFFNCGFLSIFLWCMLFVLVFCQF